LYAELNNDVQLATELRRDLVQVFAVLGNAASPARARLVAALVDPQTPVLVLDELGPALGGLTDSANVLVPPLVTLGRSTPEWRRRLAVIDALGRLGSGAVSAVPWLRTCADETAGTLSTAAQRAVNRILAAEWAD
jgi:hypothetical protein